MSIYELETDVSLTQKFDPFFSHISPQYLFNSFSHSQQFLSFIALKIKLLTSLRRFCFITIFKFIFKSEFGISFRVSTYYQKKQKHLLLPSFFKITIIPSRTPIILHRSSGRKKALMVHLNGLKGNRL